MIEYISKSEKETQAIAAELGRTLKSGDVVALFGEMGVGKTAFVRGLAEGMNIRAFVSSPTFAIVNEYSGLIPLFHYDMYRVETWDDLCSSGFFDALECGGVVAVEWSENIENALPSGYIKVLLTKGVGDAERVIQITQCLEELF